MATFYIIAEALLQNRPGPTTQLHPDVGISPETQAPSCGIVKEKLLLYCYGNRGNL